MSKSEELKTINRREANSRRLSYGDPVVLHETSKTRIVMVPFFIPHSNHTELAIKIQTYKKGKGPIDWMVFEDKSVSLKEKASRKLLDALHTHLEIKSEDDGSYLLIRVSEGVAQLKGHSPAAVASALTKVLTQPEILKHLEKTELSDELITALRGSIRFHEMKNAVTKLRNDLEQGEKSESLFQEWCENHPWVCGNAYVWQDDPRTISPHDKLDIVLSNVIAGYRDIVELKRPDMPVLRYDESHRNYYFSGEVSKGIGQCHRYLDVLHEEALRGLRDHPEVVAYHPRAILVIGRSNDWEPEKHRALHGLNKRLSSIKVMTYDHLLLQGERLLEIINPINTNEDMEADNNAASEEDY